MKNLFLFITVMFFALTIQAQEPEPKDYSAKHFVIKKLPKTGIHVAMYKDQYLQTFYGNPIISTCKGLAAADYYDSNLDARHAIDCYIEQRTGKGVEIWPYKIINEFDSLVEDIE